MMPAPGELLLFLRNQLVESASRTGRLVLISGGPGSGKTTLLREFAHHAEQSGATVLTAGGVLDEQSLPAGVLGQLIENIPRDRYERIGSLVSPVNVHDIQLIHETCAAFLELCRERPLVVVVDDLHFVDDWSIRLLRHLHRRISSARLLMVFAQWNRSDLTAPVLPAGLAAAPHHHVQLGPMTLPAVVELVRADHEDEELGARIHALSAGNPLLVSGLLEGNEDALGRAVRATLHSWGAPLLDVSRAVAILGEHADAELVAQLAGVPSDVAEDMIDILVRAGFVADCRFRLSEIGWAVLAGLSGEERVRLHLRAAAAAYRATRDAPVVAEHLVAAGRAEPGWAVASLRAAAEQAMSADNAVFATQCLELALATVADEQDRRDVLTSLAHAAWRVNPELAGRHAARLRESAWTAAPSGLEARTLVRDALWRGDQGTLSRTLKALPPGDPQTRAEILLARLWHFGGVDRDNDVLAPHPGGFGTELWFSVAETLDAAWRSGDIEPAVPTAELLLRSCPLYDLSVEALATAMILLARGKRADRADWWCGELLAEASARAAATWRAKLGAVRSTLSLWRGDPAGAAEQGTAALALLSTPSWGVALGHPLATAVLAHTMTGDHEKAGKLLRIPVPATLSGTVGGLRYLHARGRHHLATDRVLAAISDFDRCRRLTVEWGADLCWLVPWRRDLDDAKARLSGSVVAAVESTAGVPRRQVDRTPVPVPRGCADQAARPPRRLHATLPPADTAGVGAELSAAERRVAELAALGRSNRQISADLFITISTVEQHLTRVYKKLGVTGRSDLADKLGLAA